MKRYLVTVMLAVFAFGGIGAYYGFTATDRLPEYRLVAVEGDPDWGRGIELSGHYTGRFRSQFLTVTEDGSRYESRTSFYEKEFGKARRWFMERPGVKELVQEHREFMRGKSEPSGLYKDDQWLISVEARSQDSQVLELDVLRLSDGQRKRFAVELPVQEHVTALHVVDVQRFENEIHAVTTFLMGHKGVVPGLIYSINVIDLHSGALIRQGTLDFGADVPDGGSRTVQAMTDGTIGPAERIVFRVRDERETAIGENEGLRVYTYAYEEGKLAELPALAEAFRTGSLNRYELSGHHFSLLSRDPNYTYFHATRFDLDSGTVVSRLTLTAEQLGGDKLYTVLPVEDRIYVLLHRAGVAQAVVLNTADGSVLYRGEAVYDGPAAGEETDEGLLQLLHLSVRVG